MLAQEEHLVARSAFPLVTFLNLERNLTNAPGCLLPYISRCEFPMES